MTPALLNLQIKQHEAIGALTATVHGFLLSHDHKLEITEREWTNLRKGYEAYTAAANAVTDLLCGGPHER